MKTTRLFRGLVCGLFLCVTSTGQVGGASPSATIPRAETLPLSGRQQTGAVVPVEAPAAGAGASTSVNTINSSIQVQGPFQGSVSTGSVSPQPLALTLPDAVRRGIQYNLGAITAGQVSRQARAVRLAAVAQLLPDVTGSVQEAVQQINLAAQGLRIHLPFPGFRFPSVVGPFNYFDAAASFNENVSLTGIRNWRATQENVRSADLSIRDARELVALAVAGSYLRILASAARIQTANAQIDTAQVVYRQAQDRNRSGLNARIDVNRSLVELQIQQQRLTSLTNELEKQKITLARLIGLPMAQTFTLADMIPYRESPAPDLNALLQQALATRSDVQSAAAQVKAAELARSAAVAEYYPSLNITANYGASGVNPSRDTHGTFLVAGAVTFPIFTSGRIRADIQQADTALAQRKAEYEDIKGQAEQDVRISALDIAAASQQVRVANSNRSLAAETLRQAQDRFRAGVADTIELVQAQESVATAEQDYISALYALNLAQVSLARAVGQTEQGIDRLVQGK